MITTLCKRNCVFTSAELPRFYLTTEVHFEDTSVRHIVVYTQSLEVLWKVLPTTSSKEVFPRKFKCNPVCRLCAKPNEIRITKSNIFCLYSPDGVNFSRAHPFPHSILSFARLITALTSGSMRPPKIDSGVGLTQFSLREF